MSLGEHHARVRERLGYFDEHVLWRRCVLKRARKERAKRATGLESDLGSRDRKLTEVRAAVSVC